MEHEPHPAELSPIEAQRALATAADGLSPWPAGTLGITTEPEPPGTPSPLVFANPPAHCALAASTCKQAWYALLASQFLPTAASA